MDWEQPARGGNKRLAEFFKANNARGLSCHARSDEQGGTVSFELRGQGLLGPGAQGKVD